ncbi:2-succinyl-6-hydroxy-2,4-cyclohexadiene-1-carboxylate synthase [Pseudanabaena sp. FACHB-1998]|uniref:2-succinyl-6-hydroxy-2, 4-cyclohexadiene-1-carboxylate synthase n=1 Tax=Pseudanabaena sp. FACHB-1998 TaxID=2692858 RepID=UPI0016809280|nr:2-succinyl-6-hydroxy-2,4-cyclohexadiene-1-carboxylate synthase [Pseudanabaena sp. FACHB-1998]MBD2178030.1 2-succinyl-6-hydroxy-2,4-cyclohexadiene-1-carboxylate synthase [Pseudanabaena sp. FACHB-1998]
MALAVQIDNYRFTYSLEGKSNYPAILFLHGFMGDRLEFQPAITALSKHFYCVAIDLPAHGQTQIPEQDCYYTIQATAKAVISFLNFLHINKCDLVGYSMGGRLALYLTIHFPNYFHRVVLESASAGLTTAQARSDRLAQDHQLATRLENFTDCEFRDFLESWYQQVIFANLRSHPNFPQMLAHRLNNSPRLLAKSLRNFSTGTQPSLWEELAQNQIPLLLIAGELDHKFVQLNQQVAKLCQSAKLEIMPNCGHNTHFENSDLFIQKVLNFLIYSPPKN